MSRIYILWTCLLFTVACTQMDTGQPMDNKQDHMNTQPITYEDERSNEDVKSDFTKYDESKERLARFREAGDHNISDLYTNEETDKISEHLMRLREINVAQVAETDTKVIVAVMLNNHADQHIANWIEEEASQFVNDKEIVVYTDDVYWYQHRNLDAKSRANQIGENVEEFLDDFFEIKD